MIEKTYNGYAPERLVNFEIEADEIIEKLKNDKEFCERFFYGTNPKKCNIARLRSKIIREIKENFQVRISEEYFSDTLYLSLWANNWRVLDTYNKEATFFSWLRKVAINAVLKRLKDEHWIKSCGPRSAGNTRLKLLSLSKMMCKMIIDDLMIGTKYHGLLSYIYVDRISPTIICKKMGVDENEYEKLKKKAEDKLKDALLRSDYQYEEDVLRDKKKRVIEVSSEFVADLAEWTKEKTDANPLADVFGANLSDDELKQKVVDFLYNFPVLLKWSDMDRYIWRKRYIEDASPVDLAKEFGHNRSWLDNRYSRLNKKFKKAVKQWYESHTL